MSRIEAAPPILLGFVTLGYLTDRPAEAAWLPRQEREWLQVTMDREEAERAASYPFSLRQTLLSPRIWALGLVNFGLLVGLYTINFWMPQIIKEAGITNAVSIGFVAALPALAGACGMIFGSRHSDRSGERTRHLVASLAVAVGGFAAAALSSQPLTGIAFLVLAALGIYSSLPLFWTLPTAFLSGIGSAAGLALINSISNLGGYVGPQLMGYIKDQTASFSLAFSSIASLLLLTICVVIAIDPAAIRRRAATAMKRPSASGA